jgi:hypothetical protein
MCYKKKFLNKTIQEEEEEEEEEDKYDLCNNTSRKR